MENTALKCDNNVIDFATLMKFRSNNQSKTPSLYTSDGRIKPSAADPVKDKETIQKIKDCLLNSGKYGYRNYLIYVTGINVGRRAGDLLKLTIGDVVELTSNYQIAHPLCIKTEVTHIEQKTSKRITFYLNDTVKDAIYYYLINLPEEKLQPHLPLFQSQKGGHLNVRSYWKILHNVQETLNLECHLSTHSMRKTFGYHKYQEYRNKPIDEQDDIDILDVLQSSYGHRSRKQTLTYIGITKENVKKLYCGSAL